MEEEKVKQILEDKRSIRMIRMNRGDQTDVYQVGKYGVTNIHAYAEPGQYNDLPFIAIYLDVCKHGPAHRFPAAICQISYEQLKKDGG